MESASKALAEHIQYFVGTLLRNARQGTAASWDLEDMRSAFKWARAIENNLQTYIEKFGSPSALGEALQQAEVIYPVEQLRRCTQHLLRTLVNNPRLGAASMAQLYQIEGITNLLNDYLASRVALRSTVIHLRNFQSLLSNAPVNSNSAHLLARSSLIQKEMEKFIKSGQFELCQNRVHVLGANTDGVGELVSILAQNPTQVLADLICQVIVSNGTSSRNESLLDGQYSLEIITEAALRQKAFCDYYLSLIFERLGRTLEENLEEEGPCINPEPTGCMLECYDRLETLHLKTTPVTRYLIDSATKTFKDSLSKSARETFILHNRWLLVKRRKLV